MISEQLDIECGRAMVTIVIGHPEYTETAEPRSVREEIRAHGTFSAGINVITYEELISVAEQTLGDPST
jgi:hypothetical protein